VIEIRASDLSLVNTFPVGGYPLGLAFDGASIWVTDYNGNTVTKIPAQ
jgi:DNA-binding beta-propeller fold protein YncE